MVLEVVLEGLDVVVVVIFGAVIEVVVVVPSLQPNQPGCVC